MCLVIINMFLKLLGLLCDFVFTRGTDIIVNYHHVPIPSLQSDIGILVCGVTTQGLPFSNLNPAGSEGLLCIPRMEIAFKSTTVALKNRTICEANKPKLLCCRLFIFRRYTDTWTRQGFTQSSLHMRLTRDSILNYVTSSALLKQVDQLRYMSVRRDRTDCV